MPSGATTSPMIPVSSATSRTAVSSGVSPSSMWPLGRDQRRRPRRSVRPMRAARGPCHRVLCHHQAPGGGLVDPAQPAAGASATARPSHARRVARPAALPWLVVSATPPSRPPGEPVPPAVQETVRALVDLSPVLTELGQRFTAAGHEVHLVGGSVRDALLAAGAGAPRIPGRPRRHHRRPAGAGARADPRLGEFHVEHRDRVRDGRRRGAGRTPGDHHLPGRPLRPGVAQPGGGLGCVADRRPGAPRLHGERHGGVARPRPHGHRPVRRPG